MSNIVRHIGPCLDASKRAGQELLQLIRTPQRDPHGVVSQFENKALEPVSTASKQG